MYKHIILITLFVIIMIGGPFLFAYINYCSSSWAALPSIVGGVVSFMGGFIGLWLTGYKLFDKLEE